MLWAGAFTLAATDTLAGSWQCDCHICVICLLWGETFVQALQVCVVQCKVFRNWNTGRAAVHTVTAGCTRDSNGRIDNVHHFVDCLVFFFIGAPLGAIIRKGGLGTPVIVSMFFFVIYWVVDISGKKLANDGAISPFLGTFISTFVLIPMGVFLTVKSTKDSALFNADSYRMFLKRMWGRIQAFAKKFLKIKIKRAKV